MSVPIVRSLIRRSSLVAASLVLALAAGCADPAAVRVLTADMPLHLEDYLDAATIEGSELPATIPEPVEWRFDEPQPDWKPAQPLNPRSVPAQMERTGDALRVTASEAGDRQPNGVLNPIIYVDLPDWRREDWTEVLVRARTTSVTQMAVGLSTWEGEAAPPATRRTLTGGGSTPVVSDGTVQTYRIRPDWRRAGPVGSWRRLGLGFFTREPGSIEILSVSVVPTAALYADDRVGQRSIAVAGEYRRSLYTHAPGSIAYPVRVPESGQLHTALGVLGTDTGVDFRVVARAGSGEATTLLSETYADAGGWAERSVDLSAFAGQTITLALETRAEEPGTVAFWGAPTVSGVRRSDKPNVILYIFDGGSADYMSAYGYHRRTTPTLERLAAEGALFEHAYSNSGDTRLSTPSFMTSLQFSVLGAPDRFESLPAQARTMAEHMHGAGYQTAVFTDNSNASTVSGLQRGVDVLREDWEDVIGNNYNESSRYLHEGFWSWRKASPGEPYWVHFQTTDLHKDFPAPPPFAGLFVGQAEREKWLQDDSLGISRTDFYGVQIGLYAEAMAHNDYRLGQLVERLKAQGEWENTLLIIGADHGFGSAMGYIAPRLVDPMPPPWSEAILQPQASGVPLIFVWPGHIPAGQRLEQAVSMIDVLPTVLDLVGLPPAEISQGQSLVPLLMGREGWEPRPVILEELGRNPVDGRLSGLIEVVDGRWGASLEINPDPDTAEDERRPVPLLLYDLWTDPMAFWSVHAEHPDLVEKYTTFLEEQVAAHQALAARFTPGGQVVLTPGQLERLRALGYIR
jgi:arylsulfatase A-like enzyme